MAMTNTNGAVMLAPILERFFTRRLIQERRVSPHTIASYRDTFRMLLKFLHGRMRKAPSTLLVNDVDAEVVSAFLDDLELRGNLSARSRNLRLTAIHSFFRYAAFELPTHSAHVQRVLAIPSKRFTRSIVRYLTRVEVEALLAAPIQDTWFGRRDHAFILLAVQTGLRLSEITSVTRDDLVLEAGAHVRVFGKGRKERCTPLAKPTVAVLKTWLREPPRGDARLLFPNFNGGRLGVHGVQYMLNKHAATAVKVCPSLKGKRISVHLLRHTMALEMLQAGVDRAVIALWLGHESVETTQIYLEATLAMKEQALSKTTAPQTRQRLFRADDELMSFLNGL
jgi:site-specific recombinase XerD